MSSDGASSTVTSSALTRISEILSAPNPSLVTSTYCFSSGYAGRTSVLSVARGLYVDRSVVNWILASWAAPELSVTLIFAEADQTPASPPPQPGPGALDAVSPGSAATVTAAVTSDALWSARSVMSASGLAGAPLSIRRDSRCSKCEECEEFEWVILAAFPVRA